MARVFTLQFPPTAWIPVPGLDGSSNPYGPAFVANTSSDTPAIARPALAFDNSNDETAISVPFEWPAEYTSTTVTAAVYFHTTANQGTVTWALQVEKASGVNLKDGAANFDSANTFTTTAAAATGFTTKVTKEITNLDSVAAGDLVYLKLFRDAGTGTGDEDAFMTLVTLYEGS